GGLSDEQRVKVLSPMMLVMKRFLRNRLAITGLVILIVMFSFSFLGGLVTPYSQSQVFRYYDMVDQEYAGATRNAELRYVVAPGETFSRAGYAQFILALNRGEATFQAGDDSYSYAPVGENSYRIRAVRDVASATGKRGLFTFAAKGGLEITKEFQDAFREAFLAEQPTFSHGGAEYTIVREGLTARIGIAEDVALASYSIFDAYRASDSAAVSSFAFRLAAEQAMASGRGSFEVGGTTYALEGDRESALITAQVGGERVEFAAVSEWIVNAISPDVFLTVDFKQALSAALSDGRRSFAMPGDDGGEIQYNMTQTAGIYSVRTKMPTLLNLAYAKPSAEHPLGTDANGMDVITRLMYGGRVSLLVGFVVVFIEIVIGIIIGGISGYFGGWADTMLMRFVDLFNAIPYWPIMIIAGSVMDTLEIDPYARIFLLMLILGIMGWTGIARVVRGQILSLREQDFMVATEATGIRVSRRIFKHLVPNVIPLLIVQATMSLGEIIIMEATLSFLGLGIKHPLASWGSIINAATDIFVMTNFWFIWIPAGLLILLTVLGFNFAGDGLRDAFDPRMKR
ncbi:MAG: ABC transporter permease, partial [Clostridiales bacterium]|nr:ABC transporter permease [Clostridiales bacterium]